jgi:hypothetical protein
VHKLLAYNRGVNGDDLVPVVRAILAAADAIDYGSAYRLGGSVGNADVDVNEFSFNFNDVALNDVISEDDNESARGSWRLLADQNNRASWSPLHLICVQGGITHGKVSLLKALLQINNDDRHHRGTFIALTATAVSQRQISNPYTTRSTETEYTASHVRYFHSCRGYGRYYTIGCVYGPIIAIPTRRTGLYSSRICIK